MSDADAEVYREAPRSYWSLLGLGAIFGIGFAFDAVLGGAVAHLPGWLLATAIVTALWALVLYAVRSQKSLVVTDAELRVGDEAIPRSDVVGFAAGLDEEDLPVLGWPNGKPRQLRGVTLRLADGQDVVVPTRYADRLRMALGVGDAPVKGQDVRAAAKSDLPLLAEIAERAAALYRVAGLEPPASTAAGDVVFVAGRPPVGFVRLAVVDGEARVEQLAVIPKWMRQGIGTRLLERAADWAGQRGHAAVSVETQRDVPWNAPFFAARGYAVVAPRERGRVLMRREL